MFKRFSHQQLLITLGVLLGLYLLSFLLGGSKERSFEANVLSLDTAQVSKLVLTPSGERTYRLQKNQGSWEVELAEASFARAEASKVRRALGSIARLQARGLASRNEEQWSDFGVDESGVNIKIFQGEELLGEIYGGETFYQQSGLMSYVRKEGEKETLMVPANLKASFGKKPNDWRDKALVLGDRNSWNMLTFTYEGDSSFQMIKNGQNQWMYSDSTASNSSEVGSYIRKLALTKGITFADRLPGGRPSMSLSVQSFTGPPFEIAAYEEGQGAYLITSTANPGAVFEGEGLINEIFVSPQTFAFDD